MITKHKRRIIYYLFLILFLSTCFQNLSIFDFGGFSFKLSHVISITFIPLLIKNGRIKLPPTNLYIFFLYMLIISGINLFIYGFNSLLFNYIFSFYYLILILTLGEKIKKDEWIHIIQVAAIVVIIAVIIKNIINIKIFIDFFKNPYVHPNIFTFFGGGVNMEATWIALLGFSFYKKKEGVIYSLLCLFISSIYASRVGIIASLILTFTIYFSTRPKNNSKFKIKLTSIINILYFLIGMSLIYFAYKKGIFNYVIDRFFNTGDEPGSLGRLSMWIYVLKAFIRNPFGYGVGNGIVAIEIVSNTKCYDSNLHNIFFQMLLDLGFIGFIWYCIIVISFILKNYKKYLYDPFVAFIITYIILSFVQFRGGDAILFYIIGILILEQKGVITDES